MTKYLKVSCRRDFRWTETSLLRIGLLAVLLFVQAASTRAQEVTAPQFTLLGLLPGGSLSYAYDVSADGSVVVGEANTGGGLRRAFRWTAATGMVDLGTLGGPSSWARGVSANGSVVVGTALIPDSFGGFDHAFLWDAATNIMQDLGTLGGDSSEALGVSADGSVVVGMAQMPNGKEHAFRWTETAGMADLGTLGGEMSWPSAVSDNGSVVVGASQTASGDVHAFRWTVSGGMEDLGVFPGGKRSDALAVSADGLVVFGSSEKDMGGWIGEVAFRWTPDKGMQDLGAFDFNPAIGYLAEHTRLVATNKTGTIAVGWADVAGLPSEAIVWSEASGWENLNVTHRAVLPAGVILRTAEAITPDGRYVVGWAETASGDLQAYRLRLQVRERLDIVLKEYEEDVLPFEPVQAPLPEIVQESRKGEWRVEKPLFVAGNSYILRGQGQLGKEDQTIKLTAINRGNSTQRVRVEGYMIDIRGKEKWVFTYPDYPKLPLELLPGKETKIEIPVKSVSRPFLMPKKTGNYVFELRLVDSRGKEIQDADTADHRLRLSIAVVESKELKVLFLAAKEVSDKTSPDPYADLEKWVYQAHWFLSEVFPARSVPIFLLKGTQLFDIFDCKGVREGDTSNIDCLEDIASYYVKLRQKNKVHRVIVALPDRYFWDRNLLGWAQFASVVLLRAEPGGNNNILKTYRAATVAAHELAHTLGRKEEDYNDKGDCINYASGYYLGLSLNIPIDHVCGITGSWKTKDSILWITADEYDQLFVKGFNVLPSDPPVLLIVGRLSKDGRFEADFWQLFEEGVPDVSLGSEGAYKVQFLAPGGEILAQAGFDVTFGVHADPIGFIETDTVPLALAVPLPASLDQIAEVRLVAPNGTPFYARPVSSHPPIVSDITPQGEVSLDPTQGVTIQWTASDPDGDALHFDVYLKGAEEGWSLVGSNLSQTSVVISPGFLAPGLYRVEVVATDGIRTGRGFTDFKVGAPSATFTVSGTVTGLSSGNSVVLQNNGSDDLAVSANGPFIFATPLADGSPYNVTVRTQPPGQTCSVANGNGTIAGADVTDVLVTCTAVTPPPATSKTAPGGPVGLLVPEVIHDGQGNTTAVGLIARRAGTLYWTFFDQDSNHVTDGAIAVTRNDLVSFIWQAESGVGLENRRGYLVFLLDTDPDGSGPGQPDGLIDAQDVGALAGSALQVAPPDDVIYLPAIPLAVVDLVGVPLNPIALGPASLEYLLLGANCVASGASISGTIDSRQESISGPYVDDIDLRYFIDGTSGGSDTQVVIWSARAIQGSYTVNLFDDQQNRKSVTLQLEHEELNLVDPEAIVGRPADFVDGFVRWDVPCGYTDASHDSAAPWNGVISYSRISAPAFGAVQTLLNPFGPSGAL